MAFKGRKTNNKNPPILSHEFVIQNHADIVSCVALVFVLGLMVQATSPMAYMFIALHHNTSNPQLATPDTLLQYTYGLKDLCVIFFYFLICIVMHAIIQEYVFDKISRKLHLSKAKLSRFNESGQLLVFYIMSILWGGDVIIKENLISPISSLWENYPHSEMTFMFKFFYIIQLSYWLHIFPELYFQKVKREDMPHRIKYATLGVVAVSAAYLLNFSRVGLCLIVIHYISEAFYHAARLIDFFDKEEKGSKVGYLVWRVSVGLVRLGSIMVSVLTFWHGLSLSPEDYNPAQGNFNTPAIRLACLAAICLLQVYLMFNFLTDQLRQYREAAQASPHSPNSLPSKAAAHPAKTKPRKRAEAKRNPEYDELPEVDQNTTKALRQRAALKTK